MKKILIILFISFASISLIAQNENPENRIEYELETFNKVVNECFAQITIKKGDKNSIVFLCDNEMLSAIEYSISNEILTISMKDDFKSNTEFFCKIELHTTELVEIENSGIGIILLDYESDKSLKIDNSGTGYVNATTNCPSASVVNSGIGSITIKGKAQNTYFENSGIGHIDAKNLISENTIIDNSGIGSVSAYADSAISVTNNELGSVKIYGSPKQQNLNGKNFEKYEEVKVTGVKHKKRNKFALHIGLQLGFLNYLEDGDFAQGMYKLKPWGSMDAAVSLEYHWRFEKAKWFELKSGFSFSWYNFKFSDPSVRYATDSDRIPYLYYDNTADIIHIKSKLVATYINLELCPTFNISKHLSLGVGGYVGYNIGGKHRYKYSFEGDKIKNHIKTDCFEPLRYGVKAEIGFGGQNLYISYDFSKSFHNLNSDGNAINVNPICFGIKLNLITLRR